MATQFVYPGRFDDHANFLPDDPAKFRAMRVKLAGKRAEVILRKPKSKRSLDQNSYLHSSTGPFRLLADHLGYDIEEVKYVLMGQCWGWIYSELAGREIPVKPSTSKMTVDEATYFISWVIPWAATEHGVSIPLPSEIEEYR